MSRKEEQMLVNEVAERIFIEAMREYDKSRYELSPERLRTCTAWVWETKHYYLLQSYQTIVAVIEKSSDTLADCLRTVYGYTPTSAQHIAKFRHDYGRGKWGCKMVYTAR